MTWLHFSASGVWQDDQISAAIVTALQAGYRHIDTAWNYQCEKAVGEGLRQELQGGRIKREDLFITTKVPCSLC